MYNKRWGESMQLFYLLNRLLGPVQFMNYKNSKLCIVFSFYLVFNFIFKISELKCKHKPHQINLGRVCVCVWILHRAAKWNRIEKKKTKTCKSWMHRSNHTSFEYSKVWVVPAENERSNRLAGLCNFSFFDIQLNWTAEPPVLNGWARDSFMIYFYCIYFMF